MKRIELDVASLPTESEISGGEAIPDINGKNEAADARQPSAAAIPLKPDQMVSDNSAQHGNEGGRLFFPCNREDALLLLGSLCISEFFPDDSIKLGVQPGGVALVESGLRRSEAEMLQAGRPERFPVLVEIDREVILRVPRVIEYKDIIGLTFRTQSEADDFRYRPVDEFDTETFECRAEAVVFDQEGESRFAIRASSSGDRIAFGHVADRLAAGVYCLLALGHTELICRPAIALFFDGMPSSGLAGEEINFSTAFKVLAAVNTEIPHSRHQNAVVSAFAAARDTGPRLLIDEVVKCFSSFSGGTADSVRQENKWMEVAREVIKSRVALNGDHLSDDKSVLLRGALLGIVVDRVDALSKFLVAEKPSGPKVTTTAAFLLGLKRGLSNSSWKEKKQHARILSSLAAGMLSAMANRSPDVDKILSVARNETDATSSILISARGITLADWVEQKVVKPDALSQEWTEALNQCGFQITGRGHSCYSWMVLLSPGQLVEVTHCASGEVKFPMLRFYFGDGQKLRKFKELTPAFSKGGMFWYPGSDETGQIYLSCDLPSLPDERTRELIARRLAEAAELCIIPAKVPRKKKKGPP